MQRRKFLVGTAGTAIGSSALIGSGAFTTGVLEDRESNIDVVSDAVGAISLIDTMPNSDMVGYSDNPDRLEIDFTAGGAQGANVGGMFKLGYRPGDAELERKFPDEFDPELWTVHPDLGNDASELGGGNLSWFNSAFAIWNRATQAYDLTVEYDPDDDAGDSKLKIWVFNGADPAYNYGGGGLGGTDPAIVIDCKDAESVTIDDSHPDDRQFRPNKRVFVSMEIHTQDGSPADDLSGSMTFTADNARPDPVA